MTFKEKDFQSKFARWMQYNWQVGMSAVFELKITKTDSIPFSAVKKHQVEGLLAATRGAFYKIPDDTFSQKPFDCFYIKGPAFIPIMYWKPGVKKFYFIEIHDWIKEEAFSKRRSLTEDVAIILASIVGELKS